MQDSKVIFLYVAMFWVALLLALGVLSSTVLYLLFDLLPFHSFILVVQLILPVSWGVCLYDMYHPRTAGLMAAASGLSLLMIMAQSLVYYELGRAVGAYFMMQNLLISLVILMSCWGLRKTAPHKTARLAIARIAIRAVFVALGLIVVVVMEIVIDTLLLSLSYPSFFSFLYDIHILWRILLILEGVIEQSMYTISPLSFILTGILFIPAVLVLSIRDIRNRQTNN